MSTSNTSNTPRVLIYVQHLLGVGHLQRALQLALALRDQGFQVKLVSGGMPTSLRVPQHVLFHQLPPLYSADGSFNQLLDATGKPIDETWRVRRKQSLLQAFQAFAPQVLITETFPFGRRMLRFELLPLLQASRSQCQLVIASIRDILQPRSKPERNRETCEWLDAYYDHVLVHGDPSIARLENSFPLTANIEYKLDYSGYICARNSPLPAADEGHNEVIVSAGGSATGLQILTTALAAKPLSTLRDSTWRLLVSPAIDANHFAALGRQADDRLIVERNRPDFSELLKRARLSISQAGYNTVADILNSDTAAVVIPYAQANEVEQTLRAHALQTCGRVVALAESALNAETLAEAMSATLSLDTGLAVDLNGAGNSATMVARWLQAAQTAT